MTTRLIASELLEAAQEAARFPFGPQADLGRVGGYGVFCTVLITRPANTTAYAANDLINDVNGTMLTVPNVARTPGGSFYLNSIKLLTDQGGGAQTWQPRLWLYQRPRNSPIADNAVPTNLFSLSILDGLGYLQDYQMPALATQASPAGTTVDYSKVDYLADQYTCAPGSTSIYLELQTSAIFTPGSSAQYSLRFHISQL